MATSMGSRLASVTARDGVDTRKQDNSGKAAAGTEETTSVGVAYVTVGQQAAVVVEYMLPPGVDVKGSRMSSFWSNYTATADRYIRGDINAFKFTTFTHQQGFNERDIERECRTCGAGEEMLNVFRQFYNAQVTEYKRDPSELALSYVLELLADYNQELNDQVNAAALIKNAYQIFKVRAPMPEVDITALIARAIDTEHVPGWDLFWAGHCVSQLKIRKPP